MASHGYRDVDEVASLFKHKVECFRSCVPPGNKSIDKFCQKMNNYVNSHMIKEDYNTIMNGVEVPEHFEHFLANVAFGLNRELNQFMNLLYTIEVIFASGPESAPSENQQIIKNEDKEVSLQTLKDKLYDCMRNISPLINKVVVNFKCVSVEREESKSDSESELGEECSEDDQGSEDEFHGTETANHSKNVEQIIDFSTSLENIILTADDHVEVVANNADLMLDPITGNMVEAPRTSARAARPSRKPARRADVMCDICAKMYPSNAAMMIHRTSHFNHRPFTCDQCGKAFKTIYVLQNHQKRLHSDGASKTFHCDQCTDSFVTSHCLRMHMRRKHMDETTRPFKCDQCGLGFLSVPKMEDHRNKHYGLRPYCCDFCGKSFASRDNMRKHRRIFHLRKGEEDWRGVKHRDFQEMSQ